MIADSGATRYPIYCLKFGDPKDDPNYTKHRIFVEANVHGNELSGNEAIVSMAQYLAQGGNKDVKEVLDNCIIWFMPMFNPDGAMWDVQDGNDRVPRRYNNQPWNPVAFGLAAGTSSESGYNTNAQGFDVNRDFWYDLSKVDANGGLNLTWLDDPALGFPRGTAGNARSQFGYFLTPEARTWVKLFNELQPEFLIACHHEGTDVAGTPETTPVDGVYSGDLVQVALLGQAILNSGAPRWTGQHHHALPPAAEQPELPAVQHARDGSEGGAECL